MNEGLIEDSCNKSTGTKLRILYLYQHLVQHTDAEHTLSTAELMKILKEDYSFKVSRNTISDDLAMLHDCGLHIEHYESTQNKYYYDGHVYELPEFKVLVDAINEAIDTKRKISFYYTDFDIAKQRYVTNDGNPYTVSPYTLIWDGDYYYMRGFCDERQEMRNFRLDRIAEQPKILNQIVVMPPEDYTPADYSKHVFRMYDTEEPVKVQLYCHVSVMKYLIDNFGTDFECEPVDAEHFKATVSVCTSTTFYRWVFGFNGKIKIAGPQQVTDEYKEMLLSALNQM